MIYYIRDEKGSLIGLKYNNKIYYYIKNLQEDIIGITDSNYNEVCRYEYDSFGKVITTKDNNGNIISDESHIGIINPYRYRSYYYDKETDLYYLNSRYYNPEWGRFINADGIIGANKDILGYNLYVYVSNNPINNIDENGRFFKKAWNWVKKKASAIADTAKKVSTFICNVVSNPTRKRSNSKEIFSAKQSPLKITTYKTQSIPSINNKSISVYGIKDNDDSGLGLEVKNKDTAFSIEVVNGISFSTSVGNFQGTIGFNDNNNIFDSTFYISGVYTNDLGTGIGVKIEIDALAFATAIVFGYAGMHYGSIISEIGRHAIGF